MRRGRCRAQAKLRRLQLPCRRVLGSQRLRAFQALRERSVEVRALQGAVAAAQAAAGLQAQLREQAGLVARERAGAAALDAAMDAARAAVRASPTEI